METKDKLDEFINQNREAFDFYEPSPRVWQNIGERDKTQQEKKQRFLLMRPKYLTRAAAVVGIFGASYLFHRIVDSPRQETSVLVVNVDSMAIEKAAEFEETQTYFVSRVNNEMKSLEIYASTHPELVNELKAEMKALDEEYKKLQNDLGDGMASKEILDAMIQNYRIKLEVLQKMREIIENKTSTHNQNEQYEM